MPALAGTNNVNSFHSISASVDQLFDNRLEAMQAGAIVAIDAGSDPLIFVAKKRGTVILWQPALH